MKIEKAKSDIRGSDQLKRRTLFQLPASANVELEGLYAQLSDSDRAKFNELVAVIRRTLGEFKAVEPHYYRVTNANYIKTYLQGTQDVYYLQICLSGYTEFPFEMASNPIRSTLHLVDAVDAHWFLALLVEKLTQIEVAQDEEKMV